MQMQIILGIGLVGSIASIIALLIAAPGWKSKSVHVCYGLLITVLSVGFFSYQNQLSEVRKVEVHARKLIESSDLTTDGSRRGFMLASLAFLEKYKERFPETFSRAKALCDNVGVTESKQQDGVERLHQTWRLEDGSTAMKYLITGLASGQLN